jgi:hypothetical protein
VPLGRNLIDLSLLSADEQGLVDMYHDEFLLLLEGDARARAGRVANARRCSAREAVVFLYTSVVSCHVPYRTKEISLITFVCYHILLSRKRIIFATRGLLYPFSLN